MKKTVSFSKNSTNLFFHILTNCNLSCHHCYINRKQHGTNTLAFFDIEKWLQVFSKKGHNNNVIFLGGEPTLHEDLPLAVKKSKSLGYRSVTIDTNGYLFHDILEKVTPDEVDYFSFSLDGATPKTNDMIRGKGSYHKCLKGIQKASKKGFNTSLIYTVSRKNIHELSLMPSLIADIGIDTFFVQIIGLRGKSANGSQKKLQVSRSQWQEIVPKVSYEVAQSGTRAIYPKVYLSPEESFDCAGNVADNFFIFPNGRVYRCPLCEDFPLHSLQFRNNHLVKTPKINEEDLFKLNIPEGCIMNKIFQPDNLSYNAGGAPKYKIACCMLKEEIR